MRLSARETALVFVALVCVCLVIFLAAQTGRTDAGRPPYAAAAAAPVAEGAVAVEERRAAAAASPAPEPASDGQFNLTIDERGLRSDWRSNEAGGDNGSLRLDVNENGLRLHARGTAAAPSAAATAGRRCDCSCAHCAARPLPGN